MALQAMVCAVSVVMLTHVSQGASVVVVKAHIAVNDHAEGLQLRRHVPAFGRLLIITIIRDINM